MSKKIIIIGGGISGLALLHYLKKKYADTPGVVITLLEKNKSCGGTIHSQLNDHSLFEHGPNGFLSSSPETLHLIKDLSLWDEIIMANNNAKRRYVMWNKQLHLVPTSFMTFILFDPLSFLQKIRCILGIFTHKRFEDNVSIFEFAKIQFGERVADVFVDSFVKGVYGGNAKQMSFQAAFPKIYNGLREHKTLIKFMKARRKEKLSSAKKTNQMMSLKRGMGSVISQLEERYRKNVELNAEVKCISRNDQGYQVNTSNQEYHCDELYISSPAHITHKMVSHFNIELANALNQISYASIGVVGLTFNRSDCDALIGGFGYLIPSKEQSSILGVLVESNVFEDRCQEDEVFIRVMIDLNKINVSDDAGESESIRLALEELSVRFGIISNPKQTFYKGWDKAIPAYNLNYLNVRAEIERELEQEKNLHLSGNYLGGISFNDCILNAKNLADEVKV